jgi:hypothetical protein
MKNKLFLLPLFLLSLLIISCEKDDEVDPTDDPIAEETGKVDVIVDFVWGMSQAEFALNQELTHPRTGEQLTFETMKFYLSNIKLKRMDNGTWYEHPESYAIIDASSDSRRKMIIDNVPVGMYTDIEYTIGVDAARNTTGAQSGALAPSNGMFWSWSTGYIMVMAEGMEADHGMFTYHLGGFEGENAIVTEKTATFTEHLDVKIEKDVKVYLTANPARLWHTVEGVEDLGMVHMVNSNSKQLGSDFIGSINFDRVEN